VRNQVSHPYTTRRKIIVLYTLIFKLLDSKLEDKSKVFKVLYADRRTAGLGLPPRPSPSRHAMHSVNRDGSVLCWQNLKSLWWY
jgi:hypothetical protein